jgi:poly(3-hydroxybutyrate) depolymerase
MSTETSVQPARNIHHEHSVPWFWPLTAAIELGEEGMKLFQDNVHYLAEAEEITFPPLPEWATPNQILLDLDTMLLRDFYPGQLRKDHDPSAC